MNSRAPHLGRFVATAFAGLFAAILLVSTSAAQSDPPQNLDKASDGVFTGIAVVTDDLDWIEMLSRPETPTFSDGEHFDVGQRGSLALIFSNATPVDGIVTLECSIDAFDPAGSKPIAEDVLCYQGPYYGDDILHPTQLDLRFEVSPNDTPGRAGFQITLTDKGSGRPVDLAVSFEQGDAE